ncbi:mlkA [Symbiodinium sp. CCMP2592]|nr:mlkA [Symbiodinium sp. CCMP2592]
MEEGECTLEHRHGDPSWVVFYPDRKSRVAGAKEEALARHLLTVCRESGSRDNAELKRICKAKRRDWKASALSIYRGAKVKNKNDASRRFQDQRPSASPLPWTTVAAAKMVRLQQVTGHGWACAGFTSSRTVDPLGVLLAEVSTVKQSWEPEKLVVRLSDSTIKAMTRAPSLLPVGAASDEPAAPKAFAIGDFARSAAGLKNLDKLLQDLPAQYRAKGVTFPDPVQHGGKSYTWSHIVLRAPSYFQVVLPGVNRADWGKGVHAKMLQLQENLEQVGKFCKAVDELAQTDVDWLRLAPQSLSFDSRFDVDEDNVLGTGKFSTVYMCTYRDNPDQRYALKAISTYTGDKASYSRIEEEIAIMKAINQHASIIRLIDMDESTPNTIRLVLELCEGGELYDRIQQKRFYSEADTKLLVKNLLEAVEFIHSKGIMHRDLKPENILLVSKVSNTDIKVSDFGLAKLSRDFPRRLPRSTSICGSDFYLAPEVIKQEEYGREIDIWAVGVITFVVLSGALPFFNPVLHKLYRQIVERDVSFADDRWRAVSAGAQACAGCICFVLKLDADPTTGAALLQVRHGLVVFVMNPRTTARNV